MNMKQVTNQFLKLVLCSSFFGSPMINNTFNFIHLIVRNSQNSRPCVNVNAKASNLIMWFLNLLIIDREAQGLQKIS